MGILERLHGPSDVRALAEDDLPALAAEMRELMIAAVSDKGGHLGPNLGAVELTIALHRVFDSPHDPLLFDTGHQAYGHKMLTGRAGDFTTLRQQGGLSGYPSRAESPHDWIENSHASTALSYADGLARGLRLRGERDRVVVAIVGDGALTGGMAWEALNNIAAAKDLPVVIVVNDNGRSYRETVGGLAEHLMSLRANRKYERVMGSVKYRLGRARPIGPRLYDALHAFKRGVKDIVAPQALFEDLGLKYLGPIDGHSIDALTHAFTAAKRFGGPVIVHTVTQKGRGYSVAELDEADRLHGPPPFDRETGVPTAPPVVSWTDVVREELVRLGAADERLVAMTAAMLSPTGLDAFADAYPDRCRDVGIAEQHAVTSAAGYAMAGAHPVVALYATFWNRAFDQALLDVGLHRLPVTFLFDRAGVTGDDGPSHNGIWDLALARIIPGLRVAAPRDAERLVDLLAQATSIQTGPTVVRYPKGALPPALPAVERTEGYAVLHRDPDPKVLVIGVGPLAHTAVAAADRIRNAGVGVTVIDPEWVLPVHPSIVELMRDHALTVTVEDGLADHGVGSAVRAAKIAGGLSTPCVTLGVRTAFPAQAKRPAVLAAEGLTPEGVAAATIEALASLGLAANVSAGEE